MNLREILKTDFGIDFPIRGGTGNSFENPIIIERVEPNDYTSIEYGILRCLGVGRDVEWKVVEQELIKHNERKFDKIQIETKDKADKEIITQIENYYFDITECF